MPGEVRCDAWPGILACEPGCNLPMFLFTFFHFRFLGGNRFDPDQMSGYGTGSVEDQFH